MTTGPALRRDAAETAGASTEQVAWSIDSLRPTRQGYLPMRQGHSVFVEVLHDRFSEAIKGCVRGGTLLAGHPPRAPQTLTNGGT